MAGEAVTFAGCADKAAEALMADLDDRSGFGLDSVDEETRREMRRDWAEIVLVWMRVAVTRGVDP